MAFVKGHELDSSHLFKFHDKMKIISAIIK